MEKSWKRGGTEKVALALNIFQQITTRNNYTLGSEFSNRLCC